MKKFLVLLLALMMVLSLAACGSSSSEAPAEEDPAAEEAPAEEASAAEAEPAEEEEAEAPALTKEDLGIIYVGIDGAYPPYCYLNEDDEVAGFEVDVMKEIAERNGLTIECQITSWPSMFGQLDSGRIDTVGEAITKTAEKEEKYIFSKSYVADSNRFMVRGGEADTISSFEDLEGKKVGVASGQTAYEELEAIKKEYNVDFEIVPYESSTNCYDVSIGRIDASYMNPVAGMSMSNEGEMGLEVANCPAYVEAVCAYPFVQDSERGALLCQIFSDTLTEMYDDGTLSALSEQWLGTDIAVVE